MYKLHLILKYLRRRRIAWVSLIAVMLCTAMVLVVISVMGGWLRMFRASFQGLSGDVVVRAESRAGFPYYEQMIAEMQKRPEIVAAVPLIETWGLINIDNQIRQAVRVVGLPLGDIGSVNGFWDSLYLKNPNTSSEELLADLRHQYEGFRDEYEAALREEVATGRVDEVFLREQLEEFDARTAELMAPAEAWAAQRVEGQTPTFDLPWDAEVYRQKLARPDRPEEAGDPATYPGMIIGVGVAAIERDEEGEMDRWIGLSPQNPRPVKFMTLAITDDFATIDLTTAKRERAFWVVDNSRTGVFQTDEQSVYVDFSLLQGDLGLDEQPIPGIDPETFEPTGEIVGFEPARTGEVHVKLADGVPLEEGVRIVREIVDRVLAEHEVVTLRPSVETWEARYRTFLEAVEREKALVTTLFAFISVVAIFLIFCIFYMIVAEKIKDIGIIKSVGATAGGIAAIFLGYGAAIGVVGAGLGVLVGWLIVRYINEIHHAMGQLLGIQIWSAQTYMFDRIPSSMNPNEVMVIVAVAIASSVLGAVVPALRAARLKPVEALRFE